MFSSPTSHLRAPRALALALGLLALASIAATPAIARVPCATGMAAQPHGHGRQHALGHLTVAAKPPPRPVLPESVSRALSTQARAPDSKAGPRCRRPGLRRLAATAAPASAAAAIAKRPPPAHLPRTRSPRPDRRIAAGPGLAAGHPADREPRRGDPSATSSQATAEGTTEASIEVGVGGSTAEASTEGYRYSWALGYQNYPAHKHVNGFWVMQQNAQPQVDAASEASASLAHSVGQLWAIARRGPSCMSDVEMGWTVSSGQYGDLQPHLFIYAWDCGVGLGYVGQSSIPWVQYSDTIAPNAILPHDSRLHAYGVKLNEGNWWFYYDGQWLGYIPRSAWSRFFPSAIEEGEAGGEVAAPEYEPCTPMGNGSHYGTDPGAALVGAVWYQRGDIGAEARLRSYASDAAMYTTGRWRPGRPGTRFRYGGPGWCAG